MIYFQISDISLRFSREHYKKRWSYFLSKLRLGHYETSISSDFSSNKIIILVAHSYRFYASTALGDECYVSFNALTQLVTRKSTKTQCIIGSLSLPFPATCDFFHCLYFIHFYKITLSARFWIASQCPTVIIFELECRA